MHFIQRSCRAANAVLALCLLLGSAAQAQAQVPSVAPTGGIWPAGDGFTFKHKEKKTRRAVSGMACAPDAQRLPVCLLAFDEGVVMQFAALGDGHLTATGERIQLGRKDDELDAEGAATDGRYFYVTGSHAVKRSNCQANPSSQHVLRFRRDTKTGMAAQNSERRDAGQLLKLMAALPELKPYTDAKHCLGQGGIDIEGLAVRGGRLFFGLRGPTEADMAFIVSVDADAFFDGAEAKPQVHRVKLGAGRGLRDMLAVQDGILLLAGPDDVERNARLPWQVLHWDPTSTAAPRPLAQLALDGVAPRQCDSEEVKPEAMTVLGETARAYRLLVLSDGLCDGGAMVFNIPR